MKRHLKPFSVEIKKSRIQGQRSQLPSSHVFERVPAHVPKGFQKEEPQAVAEPSVAPRILPSIVDPVWSSSAVVEPVRRKRSSGLKTTLRQIELDLDPTASENVEDAPAGTLAIAKALLQTDVAPVEEDTKPVDGVQSMESESVKARFRQPRKKASRAIEQVMASKPMPGLEQMREAETIKPSSVMTLSKVADHRLTKRQAAAAQLPRYQRWKGRLHPAAW